jgi:hypothetical protein
MLQKAFVRKMMIGTYTYMGKIIIYRAIREVAGWGLRALRQTKSKSVWHSARTDPIARILKGGEKSPWPFGGLFPRLEKAGEERDGKGGVIKAIKGIALVGAKKVSPPRRAILYFY